MERLTDKFVALLACLPALACAAAAPVGASLVIALLAAVISASVAEVARGRWCAAAPLALLALGCAVPEAAALSGVAAYDLARVAWAADARPLRPLALAATAVPCACVLLAPHATPGLVPVALIGVAVGARMGARQAASETRRAAARRTRDELSAAELSLARRNRELMDARAHEVRLATLSERARIAREIHDNVGHLLTRAVVQVEALRVVGEGTPAADGLAQVADTLREALDEVRTSVHDLRDDASDLSVQLRAVTERACAGSGVEARCHVEAASAPPAVTACLVAVAREALSNALRHARGLSRVSVELVEHPALWRLTVTDDGAAVPVGEKDGDAAGGVRAAGGMRAAGRGMGLATMEERVRALGGTFRAGPGPRGGWVVFASVPRPAAEGRAS